MKEWAADARLSRETMLRNALSGERLAAGSLPALFPAPVAAGPASGPYSIPPQTVSYPRAAVSAPVKEDHSDVIWAIARAVLAVVLFFVLHGIGLIVAAYGVLYGYRAMSSGHRLGKVAFGISIAALVIVAIGWYFRMSTKAV